MAENNKRIMTRKTILKAKRRKSIGIINSVAQNPLLGDLSSYFLLLLLLVAFISFIHGQEDRIAVLQITS
jgi:hypothetical protein